MFRDLKEYQELQKLYESKVSKPEQLDEFTGLGVKKAVQMSKPKPKPVLTQKDQSDIKKEAGLQKVLNNKKNLQKIETKAAADKKEVDFRLKNTESSEQSAKAEARPKRRRVGSPMDELNPGAARVKARFKAREAKGLSGLTGKPKGQPQLSGKERAQAMAKARIAAKNKASQPKPETKSGSGVSFGDAIKLNTPKPKGTVLNTQGNNNTKQQDTATPTKTKPTIGIPKRNTGTDTEQKSNKIIPKRNTGTDTEQKSNKIIPKRNTGTDTQGTRKRIPQPNTGTDTETKTNKITPKPNTGTDTEKKTSTSSLSASDKIKAFKDKKRKLQTTAKYGSTATIQTQDGKSFKPGDPGYEAELKKARELMRNSMKKEEYEPYDIVLEYLLSSEQVATIEEANYVMTEMDAETIQDIVAEGIGQLRILPTLVKGAAAVYGVKKGAEFLGRKKGESDIKPKKKFDPIGNARKKYQDKKATEYEKKSGTTKEDGYFR